MSDRTNSSLLFKGLRSITVARLLSTAVGIASFWILARTLRAFYYSLRWPVSICPDAALHWVEGLRLLNGTWPYRDVLTLNLPLTYYINVLGLLVFGRDSFSFRILDLSWVVGVAVLSSLYLLRFTRLGALVAFVLVSRLPVEATPLGAFERETLMLPFWLGAVLCLDRAMDVPKKRWLWLGLAGLLGGASALIKPTGLVFLALGGLYYVFFAIYRASAPKKIPATLVAGLWTSSGFVLAVVLLLLPLLMAGALTGFLNGWWPYFQVWSELEPHRPFMSLLVELVSYRLRDLTLPLNGPVYELGSIGHLSWLHLIALPLFLHALYLEKERAAAGCLVLAIGGLFHYLINGKGYAYHVFPLWFAFQLILAYTLGVYVRWAVDAGAVRSRRVYATCLALGLVAVLIHMDLRSYDLYSGSNYLSDGPLAEPESQRVVGEAVQKYGLAGARLQTLEPDLVTVAATLTYDLQLVGNPMDQMYWCDGEFCQSQRRLLIDRLDQEPPEIIVIAGAPPDSSRMRNLAAFRELNEVLRSEYALFAEAGRSPHYVFVRSDLSGTRPSRLPW
ncbi:MAG: glycosyltransferase family 39 protein [Leptospiraceae bacterium]|nr:glycosyltransferase family 39 protein [Leptospiraceae bacterium]